MNDELAKNTFSEREPFKSLLPAIEKDIQDIFCSVMDSNKRTNKGLDYCIVCLCHQKSYSIKELSEVLERNEHTIRYHANKAINRLVLTSTLIDNRIQYSTTLPKETISELYDKTTVDWIESVVEKGLKQK